MQCNHCGEEIKSDISICPRCSNKLEQPKKIEMVPTPPTSNNFNDGDWYIRSKKNKIKGILWLTLPIVTLAIIMASWAIIKFITLQSAFTNYTAISILNIILSLLGIVAVLGLIVGIPLGIIYLAKKELNPNVQYDERSGKGDASEIPAEIKGWSWSAAFLNWIWGAYHNVWISFLVFVPILNYVWWIYMGINGRKLAWQSDKWPSVEYFLKKQKKWDMWGIILFVISLLPLAMILFFIPSMYSFQKGLSNYENYEYNQLQQVTTENPLIQNIDQINTLQNNQIEGITYDNPFVGNWQGANNTEETFSNLTIFKIDESTIYFELGAYYGDNYGFLENQAIITAKNTATYTTKDGVQFKFILDVSGEKISLETTDYSYQAGENVKYDNTYIKVIK